MLAQDWVFEIPESLAVLTKTQSQTNIGFQNPIPDEHWVPKPEHWVPKPNLSPTLGFQNPILPQHWVLEPNLAALLGEGPALSSGRSSWQGMGRGQADHPQIRAAH